MDVVFSNFILSLDPTLSNLTLISGMFYDHFSSMVDISSKSGFFSTGFVTPE